MFGIKNSKLVADLLEGKTSQVPVGQRALYNDVDKNSKDVLPLTVGQNTTELTIDDFDVFGDRNSLSVKRDPSTNTVSFSERGALNDGLIEEAAFDDEGGHLVIVRRNGSELRIPGFMRQPDMGRGRPGPTGPAGNDAFDGDDGDDAPDGDSGCSGESGSQGDPGPVGEAGKDGPQGISGPIGEIGEKGPVGRPGPAGRFGDEGARGMRGTPCDAAPGPAGTPGTSPNSAVVVSASAPDSSAFIWGIPT